MMIKKLNVLVAMVVVICLAGCSSDDNGTNDSAGLTADQISGTWFIADYSVANGQQQTSNGDQVSTTFFREQGKDFDMQLVFDQNTNKIMSTGAFKVDTTTLSDTGAVTGTTTSEINNLFNNADWEIIRDFIVITKTDGATVTLRINVIEDSRFIFTADLAQILGLPEGVTVSAAARFTFGK